MNNKLGIAPVSLLQALTNAIYVTSTGEKYLNLKKITAGSTDKQISVANMAVHDMEQFILSALVDIDSNNKLCIKVS